EVSAAMLLSVGTEYVIIGHSERRKYFGESDETVNKKIKRALSSGLKPIVCIGETLEQREAGETEAVIRSQLEGGLAGLSRHEVQKLILAYEPVWAIGTGRNATPEQAVEVHQFIRRLLSDWYDAALSEEIIIQYGGSVNEKNADSLLSQPDIDGALVGGASLKADSFGAIVRVGEQYSS
ncbi:MAG TPA: triose-phosphate isomerase, partial [Bacteroidetes bacterium]|nr:triose-phosphate isomerase [Bacteroidota bacterium]